MKFSVSLFKALKHRLKNEDLNIEILTNSMEPVLKVGTKVVVSQIKEELKVFDIIVFYNPLIGLVCHYIIKVPKDNKTIVTRALKEYVNSDIPIQRERILGIVTGHRLSYGRRLLIILNSLFKKL